VHRFRHTFATWAIENEARELDVQYLLGHSTPAMVRRYSATYDAEKAARVHAFFSPADRLNGRLHDGGNGSKESRVRIPPGPPGAVSVAPSRRTVPLLSLADAIMQSGLARARIG
jgi:hypothetical protein